MTTIGGLFEGYGGLTMGVQSAIGGDLSWYSEIDPAPSKIMAHHHPDVPNLGDVTRVDWSAVPPVDVITGGSPCQDLSAAGKRAGMRDGTRSGLWVSMLDAVATIRPALVVWENVRGALSACAHSELESCPGCVGDGGHRPVLRALGRVLGDLANVGYDASWYGLRAADVGAAHGRFRVFVYAVPAADPRRIAREVPSPGGHPTVPFPASYGNPRGAGLTLLKTPTSQLAVIGGSQHPDKRKAGGHGPTLADEVEHLLPTPTSTDATVRKPQDWGGYAAAIHRQEAAFGRAAPEPTEPAPMGGRRLSPRFVEWMMGLPPGHVTAPAIGISHNEQLKALGNGVVPQQAAAPTLAFLTDLECAA